MLSDGISPGDELEVDVAGIDYTGTVESVTLKDVSTGQIPTISVRLDSGFEFEAPYAEPRREGGDDAE